MASLNMANTRERERGMEGGRREGEGEEGRKREELHNILGN